LIVGSRRKGDGWEAYTGYVCEVHDQEYRELMRVTKPCPMCKEPMIAIGEIFTIADEPQSWLRCAKGHYNLYSDKAIE
jgi:hypothetical protein